MFLQRLDFLRGFACDQPVYRLLWEIYDQTGALGLYGALPNGAQSGRPTCSLSSSGRAFEGQGFRGLFALTAAARHAGNGRGLPDGWRRGVGRRGAHHEHPQIQGAEFPVVLLADCAKQLTKRTCASRCWCISHWGFGGVPRPEPRRTVRHIRANSGRGAAASRDGKRGAARIVCCAYAREREAHPHLRKRDAAAVAGKRRGWPRWDELPQYAMGGGAPLAGYCAAAGTPSARALKEQYGLSVPSAVRITMRSSCAYQPDELALPEREVLRAMWRRTRRDTRSSLT